MHPGGSKSNAMIPLASCYAHLFSLVMTPLVPNSVRATQFVTVLIMSDSTAMHGHCTIPIYSLTQPTLTVPATTITKLLDVY